MSDSPPIASGLPHCRFARREHNSQWSAVYLHRGCMSTLNLFMRRSAVETFDPRAEGKRSDLGAVESRLRPSSSEKGN